MFQHPEIKEKIKYVFPFGSKVYETNTEVSDDDYIVVIEGEDDLYYGIHENDKNIHVYSDASFKKLLVNHDIAAMECIFSNDTEYEFELNLETLRRSIAAVVSNSFSKCQRKLRHGEKYDPYGAKKSLFHSLRILDFGIQIATYGRIVDFKRVNHFFKEIMENPSLDFDDYRKIYEPIAISMRKDFKKAAPLEKDKRNKKW